MLARTTLLLAVTCSLTLVILAKTQAKTLIDLCGDALPEGAIARIGTPQFKPGFYMPGDPGCIDYLAFSLDGNQLVTTSIRRYFHPVEVSRWELATRKRIKVTSTGNPPFPNIGLPSMDHTLYFGKNGDERAQFFDMTSGKVLGKLAITPNQDLASDGYFSPNGKFYLLNLFPRSEQPAFVSHLFALPSGKLLFEIPVPHYVDIADQAMPPLVFSSDNRFIAFVGHIEGQILVFDISTGTLLYRLGRDLGRSIVRSKLVFSGDGNLLGSWFSGDLIRIWDMKTGKQRTAVHAAPGQEDVDFAFSPDGRALAIGNKKIQLVELSTLKVRREFPGSGWMITAMAFSPDGRWIATGNIDTTVLIWDVWKK